MLEAISSPAYSRGTVQKCGRRLKFARKLEIQPQNPVSSFQNGGDFERIVSAAGNHFCHDVQTIQTKLIEFTFISRR